MPRLSKIGAAALAAFGWTSGSAVSASYLVVAGGGGGGRLRGGGGGAGGLRTGTLSLTPTLSYTVTVGAGGAGSTVTTAKGSNGSDSVFSSITSTGGGGGGSAIATASSPILSGASGGSGGGGASDAVTGATGGSGGAGNTPSTSPSQGNNGGASSTAANFGGGGGGGAGGTGSAGGTSTGGAGGVGTASSISGTSVTYAGGGGGGIQNTGGAGGLGGGGTGGSGAGAGGNGTANLGGGGGGDGNAGVNGGAGGSGIVIISYAGAQKFGGGVVTSVGGNTIHTFTTSGTLVPVTPLSASYLIVAGGGAGARHSGAGAGGGGAGGLLSGSGLAIDSNSTYLVTVGAGGTIAADFAAGGDGTNSTFSMVTTSAVGGGGGGAQNSNGRSGGSGGGGTYQNGTGGAGTSGQGNNGGSVPATAGGGGGGGAGDVGSNSSGSNGGNGGNGTASSITGSSVTYAGGGGGGTNGATPGSGGTGGGGTGANASGGNATAGTANLGGGGGGAGYLGGTAGNGGSGVVIISYPGSTQQMAGGTVTITGGNVIHTFTSSGYLTPIKYVGNSLRFRSSASAYLNRTPASAGNRKTWTWSGWVKRGSLGAAQILLSSDVGTSNSTWLEFGFDAADTFTITSYTTDSNTTAAVFRDPSSWYHIVVAFDSTQATSANRCKIYVNGTQQTLTGAGFTLNADYGINNAQAHAIGYRNWSTPGRYFDGYMTEINFIDGQALTPNSFGTINSYGVWQPITYGGSYGTNGFYLPFTNKTSTTTLAYDFSPNGNNWTPSAGISLTAGATYDSMTDVPTLTSATAANYAVLNPLSTLYTVTAGNLDFTYTNSTSGVWYLKGTLAVSSDKYYWEVTPTNVGAGLNISIGIILSTNTQTNTTTINLVTDGYVYHSDGNKYSGAGGTTGVAYGATYTNNDVIGVALDLTAGTLVFYKNNVSQGTAFTGLTSSYMLLICSHLGGTSRTVAGSVNAGQRPFTYTPPTGFVALNTYNL